MTSTEFCAAEHENALYGCYGYTNHTGKHWAYSSGVKDATGEINNDRGSWIWQWDNEAPAVPAGSVAVVLTREELALLAALSLQVEKFYPSVTQKLAEALEASK